MAPERGTQCRQAFVGCFLLLIGACAHPDTVTTPIGDQSQLFTRLAVREPAIALALMAPYDTTHVQVTAVFADGSPLLERPVFTAGDSTIDVDTTGLITARFPTRDLAVVRIAVTHAGVTRHDSVQIRVLATLPSVRMARISLTLPAGATAVLPLVDSAGQGQLHVIASGIDALGQLVPDSEIVIGLRSSDPTIATVDPNGFVVARHPGHVFISATTLAYGRTATDSLPVTVGFPMLSSFEVFSPGSKEFLAPVWRLGGDTARIAVGGTVVWSNWASELVDIIFADTTYLGPASATPLPGLSFLVPPTGSGSMLGFGLEGISDPRDDIFATARAAARARAFLAPGAYPFHGVVHGSTASNQIRGVVIVCAADDVVCDP